MKEKLSVGMYVRTEYGIINKIVGKEENKQLTLLNIIIFEKPMIIQNEFEYNYQAKTRFLTKSVELFIVKSSFNIIDLIEVGDYVNGKKVIKTYNPEGTYCLWIALEDEICIADCESFNIKEILTHEQYENNVYRIGE